jgi:adenine deaminase
MGDRHVPGLGEFMNVPGVLAADEDVLSKLEVALNLHKVIDGHSPGFSGAALNAYISAGVKTDHECTNISEMEERLEKGMYVLLRDGSACHDLERPIPGITPFNTDAACCARMTGSRRPFSRKAISTATSENW